MIRLLAASFAFPLGLAMATAVHGQAHIHGSQALPQQSGQAIFAAIQEIVALLIDDPETDWSRVDIPALREHLTDMHAVTLNTAVRTEVVGLLVTFTATGDGRTVRSIQRMLSAHVRADDLPAGWRFSTASVRDGATLSVLVANPEDVLKVRALGLIGLLTMGMHHQRHHLSMATGHHQH